MLPPAPPPEGRIAYAELERHDPSPVVTINRAVAAGFAEGAAAERAALERRRAMP